MSSVAVPPRDGSPVALVAVSEDADTPRPCRPPAVDLSTHHLDRVGMEADSAEASVAEAEVVASVVEVSAAGAIASVVLAVVSDTRATVAASVDKRPLTRPLALVVDAVEVSEVVASAVIVVTAVALVVDSTVVQLAAIRSLCGLGIAMLTVTAVTMTVTTVTETVIVTAWETEVWETETETDSGTGIVNVVVTGMAAAVVMVAAMAVVMVAGRIMDASETVRTNLDTMIPVPGEGTRPSLIPQVLPLSYEVWFCLRVSLIYPVFITLSQG